MQNLHKHFSTRRTPQDQPLDKDQVATTGVSEIHLHR